MLLMLPNEIIATIVANLPNRACFALATTCRLLHDIAIRRLYDTIYLDDFNIAVFLRALYEVSVGPLFSERCLMIRDLSVVVRDPIIIARANPHLCTVLRSAYNLQSFSSGANGFSGKILFMFLSRSSILRRRAVSPIPTLRALPGDMLPRSSFLENLFHLHVGSSIGLFKMAIGRKVQAISVSMVHHLRSETMIAAISWISNAEGKYPSLRKLSFSMIVESSEDVLRVSATLFSVCENLEDLAITVLCTADHVCHI